MPSSGSSTSSLMPCTICCCQGKSTRNPPWPAVGWYITDAVGCVSARDSQGSALPASMRSSRQRQLRWPGASKALSAISLILSQTQCIDAHMCQCSICPAHDNVARQDDMD